MELTCLDRHQVQQESQGRENLVMATDRARSWARDQQTSHVPKLQPGTPTHDCKQGTVIDVGIISGAVPVEAFDSIKTQACPGRPSENCPRSLEIVATRRCSSEDKSTDQTTIDSWPKSSLRPRHQSFSNVQAHRASSLSPAFPSKSTPSHPDGHLVVQRQSRPVQDSP